MKIVTGIRFKRPGKIYYFDKGNLQLERGMHVIVDTAMGPEYGEVVYPEKEIEDESTEIKKVIRIATEKDEKNLKHYKSKEKNAFDTCLEKIEKHNLPMKLIDAEYKFDGSKLVFYFTADGRIDFRELVKDLAAVFKTRIELRQIGVRDKAREVGGLGPCGRMLCCNTFLTDLNGVTINMAKNQMLALNPTKINGSCGRLLCCLSYEDVVYSKLREKLPDIGEMYNDKNVSGKVVNLDILGQKIYIEDKQGNIVMVEINNGNNK